MAKTIRFGINGFGRIGRKVARLALADGRFEITGINDLTNLETMVHLFKHDSVHGPLPYQVRLDGSNLLVSGKRASGEMFENRIALTSEKDPTKLPWKAQGAEFAHECTGIFTDKEKAMMHITAGAKRVIISAPSKDAEQTLCMGVNEDMYDPSKHFIVSNASCTTNCLAPLVKVIDQAFGVQYGTMMTVHSYTNDQQVLDLPHKDLRRARAAAMSMIPTSTGAAKAVGLVLPHLKGKLDGLSIRVPTPNVSMVDFTGRLSKSVTRDEVNQALEKAANGPMKNVLGYSKEPLVSVDYNGNTFSSTIDSELTTVIGATPGTPGDMVKVISWYDNESGFSQRMLDLTAFMASK